MTTVWGDTDYIYHPYSFSQIPLCVLKTFFQDIISYFFNATLQTCMFLPSISTDFFLFSITPFVPYGSFLIWRVQLTVIPYFVFQIVDSVRVSQKSKGLRWVYASFFEFSGKTLRQATWSVKCAVWKSYRFMI